MKKLLQLTDPRRTEFINRFQKSLNYYFNKNDITNRNNGESKTNPDGKDEPLRKADNRVSSNFHQLLVDQEAGYLATIPPAIDVENDKLNESIKTTLGDNFNLRLNQLVVDAANAGVAWVHYWIDEQNQFRYGIVPPGQVTPIYSNDLDKKLLAVRRTYQELNPDTGKNYSVHEYWNDKTVTVFKSETSNYDNLLQMNDRFPIFDASTGNELGSSNVLEHHFGRIPFISFPKNKYERPDLFKYKGLIDVYDNVYNGFVNDVDDVQQVILVLTNYGGEEISELVDTIKEYKAIKLDNVGTGDKSGLDKLTIDIPTEARNSLLDITKSDLFVEAQGIDPTDFATNNATGTAIKMLYSHLELKASMTESYFRDSLNELVRAIMRWMNVSDYEGLKINQKWTRTAIHNSLEDAQVISQVANYSSDEAIAKANPIVDDWQEEMKNRKDDMVRDPYDDGRNPKDIVKTDEDGKDKEDE
ncbi:Phage portal protein, SPP1 Gp6-like [Companilactobacillus nantensis DSM 16982]|uniref:Phage portal protein, SPP1 Gp6-like n=2 Tax=Companilactobacillus nantensis TaxID=305793 RepID=A0A0R1WHJ0_9LACO|nr:Phage portal protein, SPP1 Gp6-like [Companilactobacillus nantensis DSM 16982]